MNNKYRKKQEVVEAFQMTRGRRVNNYDWPTWLNEAWNKDKKEFGAVYPSTPGEEDGPLSIRAFSGEHSVSFGDYIIKGSAGELYPCKGYIFESTYEKVEE